MLILICERPYFALILTYPSYGGPLPRIKYKCESACSALDLLLVNERGEEGERAIELLTQRYVKVCKLAVFYF